MPRSPVVELYAKLLIAQMQYERALETQWEGEELYAIKAALNAARLRYDSAVESNLSLTPTGVKEAI